MICQVQVLRHCIQLAIQTRPKQLVLPSVTIFRVSQDLGLVEPLVNVRSSSLLVFISELVQTSVLLLTKLFLYAMFECSTCFGYFSIRYLRNFYHLGTLVIVEHLLQLPRLSLEAPNSSDRPPLSSSSLVVFLPFPAFSSCTSLIVIVFSCSKTRVSETSDQTLRHHRADRVTFNPWFSSHSNPLLVLTLLPLSHKSVYLWS